MTTLRPPSIPRPLPPAALLALRALALLLVPALLAAVVAGPFAQGLQDSILDATAALTDLGGW